METREAIKLMDQTNELLRFRDEHAFVCRTSNNHVAVTHLNKGGGLGRRTIILRSSDDLNLLCV